ncbi:uncharacterized protein LOC121387588 [Gigantopelta aegis]|uniref:uncharacterized protein LOC121387588 n=1 Tax=Gigantopelta aegis TaxID=1735272 RepID=UPI001B88D347|nr:uncharacterized protein LOC121387588 [Gigantopelta aegis]
MSPSKFKAMLIVFFDVKGIVMAELFPSGQTINQLYYIHVFDDTARTYLALCDFYLFPKIKSMLKGTHLSVEEVKANRTKLLGSITQDDLRNCFEMWKHRMQLCVNSEGNYFEGDQS